jgi:predicted O-methyltransferase YrrM
MATSEATPHEPMPESRFVPADKRCPHPERWHSTDGDSTELEVSELIAGLVRGLQPRLVVETGSAFGQTTKLILDALDCNGHGALVTFESDAGRREQLLKIVYGPLAAELIGREPNQLRRQLQIAGSSLEAEGALDDDDVIDFAFLDTFYETRVPEFLHLRRWMRPGTIVAFHDTRPGAGEDRIASGRSLREEIVVELEDPGLFRAVDLPTPRGLTLGEVL